MASKSGNTTTVIAGRLGMRQGPPRTVAWMAVTVIEADLLTLRKHHRPLGMTHPIGGAPGVLAEQADLPVQFRIAWAH